VAEVVEALMQRLLDYEPGPRIRHDAGPGRLAVDFVYDDAQPTAIALEVTSMVNHTLRATLAAVERHNRNEGEAGESRELVVVDEWERVKDLDSAVGVAAVRSGPGPVGGCADRIQSVVESNAGKLHAARPRETHLAIWVEPLECSPDPRLTAAPRSDHADWVWVLFGTGQREPSPAILMDGSVFWPAPRPWAWYARRGEIQWTPIVD